MVGQVPETEERIWQLCTSGDCLLSALYDWQTLVTGIVAIGAAWVAAHIVRQQINQAREQENERLRRREIAARATLPLTLAGLSDYARGSAAELKSIVAGLDILETFNKAPTMTPADPPAHLIGAVERMIEATSDANVIRMLRAMLADMQVLNSRMNGLALELELEPEGPFDSIRMSMDVYLLQCGVIYAQSASLFDYARFKADTVPAELDWQSVYGAFQSLGVHDHEFPKLYELCGHLRDKGKSPES